MPHAAGDVGAIAWANGVDANKLDKNAPSLQLGTDAQALTLNDALGLDGRRLSIQPVNAPTSAAAVSLELVPGTLHNPATGTPSQLLFYNQVGTDYERFTLTCHANQYLVESTYNGAGAARDILFQVGGSISNAVAGQNALVLYADASVDLQGGTYTQDGKSWGATKTRVADPHNTGDSRLIIDTRTGTPADNVADTSSVDFRRGGSSKWHAGLNFAGSNTDSFDFYSQQGAGTVLALAGGATAKVGFLGAAPVARAAAITTPTSDTVGTKAAIDAIRVALTNIGITA